MALTFSGLLPHPPIVVPAVGGSRGAECRQTTDACRALAGELVASGPERLVVVSPHSPRRVGEFGWWSGDRLRGDLGRFGASEAAIDLPNDLELTGALTGICSELSLSCRPILPEQLDHGAVVPLWFLAEAGWDGPTTILSLPWPAEGVAESEREVIAFGRAVALASEKVGGPYALLASGDMTHRGQRGAPAGYHPRAAEFDASFRERVERGELGSLTEIPADLRELAAEDVVTSSVLVAAALDFTPREHRVLSYEIPFGVGYLVAVFHRGAGE